MKVRLRLQKKTRSWRKTGASLAGLAALAIILLVALVLPEAHIKVTARTETATRDLELQVDKNQTQPDAATLIIPGRILELELADTKTFPATGKKNIGKTASGFVYVYNFSKNTLILKAKTTTLTADGKKYYFTQDVGNIRPTAFIGLEDQEIDKSSLVPPVPVAAAEGGEQYNLPVGTRLEITNEVFGHQPKALYAVVAENLAGGTTEQIKVVTESDAAAAFSSVEKVLVEKARQDLKVQNPDLRILDNAFAAESLEQKTNPSAGTASDEFTVEAKIRLRALVFNEADVKTLIAERIKRLLPENKVLEPQASTRISSSFVVVNIDEGKGTLNNHFEGKVVYQIDSKEIAGKIKGKSAAEIREILLSRPEISSVEIKFYPFWVKHAPKFQKKIYLEIMSP